MTLSDRLRATGPKRQEYEAARMMYGEDSPVAVGRLAYAALAEADAEVARLREQLDLFIAGQEAMRDRAEAAEAKAARLERERRVVRHCDTCAQGLDRMPGHDIIRCGHGVRCDPTGWNALEFGCVWHIAASAPEPAP